MGVFLSLKISLIEFGKTEISLESSGLVALSAMKKHIDTMNPYD